MKTAQLRVHASGRRAVGTVTITDAAVRAAIAQYDIQYPENDYPRTETSPHIQTWFQNSTYTFAIRYEGECYPPKPILRLAIGSGPQEGYVFYGGSSRGNANWVLEQLGFDVVDKYECREATEEGAEP